MENEKSVAGTNHINIQSLVKRIGDDIAELKKREKKFNNDFDNAKCKIFRFLGYNTLESKALLLALKALPKSVLSDEYKKMLNSIETYPENLFNIPLSKLKALKKSLGNQKAPVGEESLKAINHLAVTCYFLAINVSELKWSLVESLDSKQFEAISNKFMNEHYSPFPGGLGSKQIKLVYAAVCDTDIPATEKYKQLPPKQFQAIEHLINSKVDTFFKLLLDLSDLPTPDEFTEIYKNWSDTTSKLMSGKISNPNVDTTEFANRLSDAAMKLITLEPRLTSIINDLKGSLNTASSVLSGQIDPDAVLPQTQGTSEPQSSKITTEQHNSLNKLGDDHMTKENEQELVDIAPPESSPNPSEPITPPGVPDPNPAASPAQPQNELWYANLTQQQSDALIRTMAAKKTDSANLIGTVMKECGQMEVPENEKGFHIFSTPTETYNKDQKKITDDLDTYSDASRELLYAFQNTAPTSPSHGSIKSSWSERCYSLSLLIDLYHCLVKFKAEELKLRYKLYQLEIEISSISSKTQAEKDNKATKQQQQKDLAQKRKTLIRQVDMGLKLIKNASSSYNQFSKLDPSITSDKEVADTIAKYDTQLRDHYKAYATFEKDCNTLLSSIEQSINLGGTTKDPSDDNSGTTTVAMPSAAPAPSPAPAVAPDPNVAAAWQLRFGPLSYNIDANITRHSNFIQTCANKLSDQQNTTTQNIIQQLKALQTTIQSYKTVTSPPTDQQAQQEQANYDALLNSDDYKNIQKIMALANVNITALLTALTDIKQKPYETYLTLDSKQKIDTLLAPLANSPTLQDLKDTLDEKLKALRKYTKFIAPGPDFKRPSMHNADPVQEIPPTDPKFSAYDNVITPLNEAIKAANDEVGKAKNPDQWRRLHEEKYKDKVKKNTAKKGEKEYRLSVIRGWISKYLVRLGNYLIANPDKTVQDKTLFIPSSTALNPADAAKIELCNALYDVKISLDHLDPRNPSEIKSGWTSLTSVSAIDKKLKGLEKAKTIQGRTEKMIYNLYAVLHALSQNNQYQSKPVCKRELGKLAKKFDGASGLAMRLSGATIYKAKLPFKNLIEFLIDFLDYKAYQDPNGNNTFMQKPIRAARKEVVKSLSQKS